jgi:hypothetical protein
MKKCCFILTLSLSSNLQLGSSELREINLEVEFCSDFLYPSPDPRS